MKKSVSLILAAIVVAAGLTYGWHKRDAFAGRLLEAGLNASLKEAFAGSIRLSGVHVSRRGQLGIAKIEAAWQTPNGPFPLELESLLSETPVRDILSRKPAVITFKRLKPFHSSYGGVRGRVMVWPFSKGRCEAELEVVGLGLEELAGLEPVNLGGSSGLLAGKAVIKIGEDGGQEVHVDLASPEPGGRIQARFFDALKPYLPQASYKSVLKRISKNDTVAYKHATLNLGRTDPRKINLLFKILVPDYNLDLNLNVEVRVEEENAYFQIAQVMGWVRTEP